LLETADAALADRNLLDIARIKRLPRPMAGRSADSRAVAGFTLGSRRWDTYSNQDKSDLRAERRWLRTFPKPDRARRYHLAPQECVNSLTPAQR
jgi:hypothetical protein